MNDDFIEIADQNDVEDSGIPEEEEQPDLETALL